MDIKLHHFAYNIKPNKLEILLEFFEILGCKLSYREGDNRWCLLEQEPILAEIQIIETEDYMIPIKKKINTHIAFLSDNPKEDIEKLEKWASNKKIKYQQGGWSDKEMWFDLPDIFNNFVIEIMHDSIVE